MSDTPDPELSFPDLPAATRRGLLVLVFFLSGVSVLFAGRRPPQVITELKPFCRDTVLAENGGAAAKIVYPDKPGYHELALEVAKAVKSASGAELPLITESEYSESDRETNLVCLGRMNNNRLALDLYIWRYIVSDDWFPGPDGFEFRTASDPWGNGRNVIMLGGSDLAGVELAVSRFVESLPSGDTLVVPYTIDTWFKGMEHLDIDSAKDVTVEELFASPYADVSIEFPEPLPAGKELSEEDVIALLEGEDEDDDTPGLSWVIRNIQRLHSRSRGQSLVIEPRHIVECAEMYYLTGREEYAEAWAFLTREWMDSYYRFVPFRQLRWTKYVMGRLIRAFDLIEESPSIPDELKLEMTNLIYDNILRRSISAPDVANMRIAGHFVRMGMGYYESVPYGYDYLRKYYPDLDMERIEYGMHCIKIGYETMSASGVMERQKGYTGGYHTVPARVALALGDHSYFDSGGMRSWMFYTISATTPVGGTFFGGHWRRIVTFPMAAWYYNDPEYMGYLNLVRKRSEYYPEMTETGFRRWIWSYIPKIEPRLPSGHTGVYHMPLHKANYVHIRYDTNRRMDFPPHRAFHHVVMREGFGSGNQYLRLGGIQFGIVTFRRGDGVQSMYDGRTIDGGQHPDSGPETFSTALIRRLDQKSSGMSPLSDLHLTSNFRNTGFIRVVMHDYDSIDWARNVVWVKGGYWVFFDQFNARESGEYDLRTQWYIGRQRSQEPPPRDSLGRFAVRSRVIHFADRGEPSLGVVRHETGVYSYLQETFRGSLEAGDGKNFAHLVYGNRGGEPPYSVFRVDSRRVVVDEPERKALIGVAPLYCADDPLVRPDEPMDVLPGVKAECAMFVAVSNELTFAGLTMLEWEGARFESDRRVDLRLDVETGVITVYAEAPALISFAGLNPVDGGASGFMLEAGKETPVAVIRAETESVLNSPAAMHDALELFHQTPVVELEDWEKLWLKLSELENPDDDDLEEDTEEDAEECSHDGEDVFPVFGTPLHRAAHMGDVQAAERILAGSGGIDVDTPDDTGRTPLHLAASMGHPEVIDLLVDAGADIDWRTPDGSTPLHWAVYLTGRRDSKTAAKLLERGADAKAARNNGTTPLHLAATRGLCDIAVLLLNKGADIDAVDQWHRTPLVRTIFGAGMARSNTSLLLVNSGADIHLRDHAGRVPLHWASMEGLNHLVELLIEKGALVDTADDRGSTPLHWAAIMAQDETVELLIQKGADPRALDKRGRMPLERAVCTGRANRSAGTLDHSKTVQVLTRHLEDPETGAQD